LQKNAYKKLENRVRGCADSFKLLECLTYQRW
jgi:hypothetical protein